MCGYGTEAKRRRKTVFDKFGVGKVLSGVSVENETEMERDEPKW